MRKKFIQILKSMASQSGKCNVCAKESSTRCSRCKSIYYCSSEHQKADWKSHKKACNPAPPSSSNVPSTSAPKIIVPKNPNDKLDTFVQWLEENGVKGLENVEISDFTNTGRGLKAKKDIPANCPLIQVPRHMFVALSDTLRSHPELSKVFSNVNVWTAFSQSPQAILAIRILYEKLSTPNSPWRPWLDVLPQTYNSTIFWSKEDMDLIKGGELAALTDMQKKQISGDYTRLVRQCLTKYYPKQFPSNSYTESEFLWAMATVHSRATESILDGAVQIFIVPFMDMLNHTFESYACEHKYSSSSNTFDIVSTKGSSKDDQVFINYGPFGNSKLLLVYGFTIPENQHDYLQLYLYMDPSAELYDQKVKLLKARGIEASPSFYLRLSQLDDSFPMDIIGTVRVQRLIQDDLPRAQYAFNEVEIVSIENEVHVLKSLEEALKALFMAYFIPYDIDLDTAEKVNRNELNLTPNEMSSLLIRMGDRRIIGKAGGHIAERMKQIQQHLMEKINSGDTTPLVPDS